MPFRDLDGAARLIERIDEVLALVKGLPLLTTGNANPGIAPTLRHFSPDELAKFDDLDGRIWGLMTALEVSLPPRMQRDVMQSHHSLRGYTELQLMGYSVDFPSEWSRRLMALKSAAQEILDVASSNNVKPVRSRKPDRSREARDKWIYEKCCQGAAYKTIISELAKRKKWESIDSKQGIRSAAKRYADLHGLPHAPKRQGL